MLSVIIIAKDEEIFIKRCIQSAKKLSSDVVVVVDRLSKDQTYKLAKQEGVRVMIHDFLSFSDQKNFATSQAKHSWVLSLDADEILSEDLILEIKNLLSAKPEFNAYSMPRINYIFGKKIQHTNWSPEDDRHVWLYNKNYSNWTNEVHEQVATSSKVGKLYGAKIHTNYSSVEEFISQLNHYTQIESKNPKLGHFFVWKFFRHYFLKLGFLDGWHGFFLSYLQSLSGLTVWLKHFCR